MGSVSKPSTQKKKPSVIINLAADEEHNTAVFEAGFQV